MLSYALLMAMLYGTENKNLKTLLAVATALSMLKGKSPKRIRRPRSRRARRIVAERLAEKKDRNEDTLQKIETFLPVVAKVLEAVTTKAREGRSEQRVRPQGNTNNKVSKVNINNSGKKKVDYDQAVERAERGGNAEYDDNFEYIENKMHEEGGASEEKKEIEEVEHVEAGKEELVTNPSPNVEESDTLEESFLSEEEMRDDNEVVYEGKVYKVDSYQLKYDENDITETIKEIFHGINVTVTLNNGQTINGEVIGSYRGILILRNASRLNYIRGEAIARFY